MDTSEKISNGKRILDHLIEHCLIVPHQKQYLPIKSEKYSLRVYGLYPKYLETAFNHSNLESRRKLYLKDDDVKIIDVTNNYRMFVYFKGSLDFYKNFGMTYLFVKGDDNVYRIRSISEQQGHNFTMGYWTTAFPLPLDENKIYLMLYTAMNLAFNFQHKPEKIDKFLRCLLLHQSKNI